MAKTAQSAKYKPYICFR